MRFFTDEVFIPDSSPHKVNTNIYRLNNVIKSQNFPLKFHSRKKYYFNEAKATIAVKCYQEIISESDVVWGKILNFSEGNFKPKEVAQDIDIDEKSTVKLFKQYVDEGKLEKLGRGSNTRYRIKKSA